MTPFRSLSSGVSCEILDVARKNTNELQYFLSYVVEIPSPIAYS